MKKLNWPGNESDAGRGEIPTAEEVECAVNKGATHLRLFAPDDFDGMFPVFEIQSGPEEDEEFNHVTRYTLKDTARSDELTLLMRVTDVDSRRNDVARLLEIIEADTASSLVDWAHSRPKSASRPRSNQL